jgi:hypothetical protein
MASRHGDVTSYYHDCNTLWEELFSVCRSPSECVAKAKRVNLNACKEHLADMTTFHTP